MRSRTRAHIYGESGLTTRFCSAVSLHSHTNCSKENLEFLPYYALRIPVVGRFMQAELDRYERTSGSKADFKLAYWTPPVSPADVLKSEQEQIANLNLDPIVSITDHDTIQAGLNLTAANPSSAIPISVEWTVTFTWACTIFRPQTPSASCRNSRRTPPRPEQPISPSCWRGSTPHLTR